MWPMIPGPDELRFPSLDMKVLTILVALLLGALTWSFLEYCIHRWLGHDARLRPNIFEHEHTRHHAQGDYFAPTGRKLVAAALAMVVLGVPASLLAGPANGLSFVFGLVGFYLFYELVHRRAHTHAPTHAYGRWVRRNHFTHHFTNPRFNHGVTSPLWDWVFSTSRPVPVVVVPNKLAMVWLLDPTTGDVKAEHADVFRLRVPVARQAEMLEG